MKFLKKSQSIFSEAARLQQQNVPFAIATLIQTEGSTPRRSAKMIVKLDGAIIGTIGGGAAEGHVIQQALEVIKCGKPRTVEFKMNKKVNGEVEEYSGKIEVFIEYVGTVNRLVLIGAGHVNSALAKLAHHINFSVTVVEDRAELCTEERFPFAAQLSCKEDLGSAIDAISFDENTVVVIATRSHATDATALECLADKKLAYLGMIGSQIKVKGAFKILREKGIPESSILNLKAPIGLNIGAETPDEISISILSEILMVRNNMDGTSLSAGKDIRDQLVIVRGGGDIATGVIYRLAKCGFKVLVIEIEQPTVIRHTVSFAQAMFEGSKTVEGVTARKIESLEEMDAIFAKGEVPILADEKGDSIVKLKPGVLVDAILAKRNIGTTKDMAPLVIGLGPGFTGGKDVDAVVETNRGHFLGSVIWDGPAEADTGAPGDIVGFTNERVVRSPNAGVVKNVATIGDCVEEGQLIMTVGGTEILAPISGVLRGLINEGQTVPDRFKIGDVDPRNNVSHCYTITEKAKAVGGGVLEAVFSFKA